MTVTTTTPTPAPARVTPTAAQPVRVPWGDWLAQALAHETSIIEAVAGARVNMALSAVPVGSVIKMFIGPELVKQYVDIGLKTLEGVLEPKEWDPDSSNKVLVSIANLINNNEAAFVQVIGDQLQPLIKAELSKLGLKF